MDEGAQCQTGPEHGGRGTVPSLRQICPGCRITIGRQASQRQNRFSSLLAGGPSPLPQWVPNSGRVSIPVFVVPREYSVRVEVADGADVEEGEVWGRPSIGVIVIVEVCRWLIREVRPTPRGWN